MADPDEAVRATLEMLYQRFNERDVDAVLAYLTSDVDWPNGWEGGYLHGHDQIRDYWRRQWAQIDPTVTPVGFATEADGRIDVLVDQVVKNLDGELLDESTVHHVYRLRGSQIAHMEIRK
jgi:ketosteroid isomerase-like protein